MPPSAPVRFRAPVAPPTPADAPPQPRGPRQNADARRLAALDEHKRSFLRMVSHELRTPLNAIIGFSEIIACELYGPLGSPQYREYAEHVRQSGHKLLRLVNQVLEIARLEGHALDVETHPEPLDHAVDDAMALLREEIVAGGAHVSVENLDQPGAPLPAVLADPRGLRTIIVNLIQNGISHGDAKVTVRVRRSDPSLRGAHAPGAASPWVEIAVEDTGPGVPADDLPRLVRPFEQGEAALTRQSQGAGLGLPIVHLLCQAMGGSLRLRSDVGRGFTAVVTLPGA